MDSERIRKLENTLDELYKHLKSVREEPIIQLADIFAGLTCFSRKKSYECWIEYNKRKKQQSLFRKESEIRSKLSKTDLNRFELIFNIYELCRKSGLNVSLRSNKYLWTPNPSNPLNFWHYEPQHENDKTPIKQ